MIIIIVIIFMIIIIVIIVIAIILPDIDILFEWALKIFLELGRVFLESNLK